MPEVCPSTILLIVILTIVGVALLIYLIKLYREYRKNKQKINVWPPLLNACPDYWADLGGGQCQNVHNLGSCPSKEGTLVPNGTFNFSNSGSLDTVDGRRKLCLKTKECGITWEHIDNLC